MFYTFVSLIIWQWVIIVYLILTLCDKWTAACQATLCFTICWSLLKLMSTDSMMPFNHPILFHPLILCPQYFPASESFPASCPFTSGGQSIGASALASVLPMNIQGWFILGLTGLISFQSKDLSRVFSSTTFEIISSLVLSLLYRPILTSIHDYWKIITLSKRHLSVKWRLCFLKHCLHLS